MLFTSRLTRWPGVALKVKTASCPATVVVTVTGAPPGVIAAVTGEMLVTCTVTLPVRDPCGSMKILYVPLAASVSWFTVSVAPAQDPAVTDDPLGAYSVKLQLL